MRRLAWVVALVLLVWTAGGCGGHERSGDRGKAVSSGAPAKAQSQEYESKDFAIPLTASVDTTVLNADPAIDSEHLLFWDALYTDGKKIRFLVPVEIYRSGSRVAPPKHFLRYVHGLRKRGAKFTDASRITVDGRPATLLTATTSHPLDATLGCSAAGDDIHEECFGIQPDFRIRMAVIEGGRSPLLAWARIPVDEQAAAFEATFETMLKSVRFR